ncbi:MAG: hypothetical protein M1485_03635 [Chloroflexi bacterium]|nr:hypothetical protein [Chloroflexota bacterium]
MKWIKKHKLAVLMAFHGLWGLFLWFSISKYGLGISTDSAHLLFAGLNLSEGRGLISFDGSFVSLWPPLYPVLLAFIHILSGLDVFISATILQILSFVAISFCLSILFLKIFPDNFLLAVAGNVLSDVGIVVLATFRIVDSDYVYLMFAMIFVLLAGYYIEHNNPRIFLAMFIVGMLAALQRYIGVASIATGAAVILFFSKENLRQRIVRSLLMGLSALPAGIWLVITTRFVERRPPIGFTDNFETFSKSVLEWFFQTNAIKSSLQIYIAGLWIFIAGLILLVLFSSRRKPLSSFAIPILVYGAVYLFTLFGSASVTYFNKLEGRFLLPLYIPFVTLLVLAASALAQFADKIKSQAIRHITAIGIIGLLAAFAGSLLQITLPLVLDSHRTGAPGENAFNTKDWRENSVMKYWLKHQPSGNYLLFSNYSDGIAFYTWHSCYGSPRKFSGPYGKEEFPVTQYTSELFASGQDVYIIWIEPNAYSYYYPVEELSPIANIKPIFTSKDGGIYNLKPIRKP